MLSIAFLMDIYKRVRVESGSQTEALMPVIRAMGLFTDISMMLIIMRSLCFYV